MPRYDQELIQKVSEANDIVEIISEYVPLKRKGKTYSACCPFHSERTPSFHVDRDKQLYHCFGCGVGGNLYNFIMEKENLSFTEAVKYLANRAGIELPKYTNPRNQREQNKRNRLYEMHRLAGNYYYKNLKNNSQAKAYLKNRDLDEETIREFAIGFAPNSWSSLLNLLTKSRFSVDEILDSGLILKNQKNNIYDRFRNRIIFPIQNVMGKVIGFGARKYSESDQGPKYLNSPETDIFNKGTQLYNLNRAKKALRDQPLILVEGYMDVIALSKHGFKNTAAALGTAFTPYHAKLISRYTKDVILCFDGDSAGEKATLRALDVLTDSDLNIKIIRLPIEHDPDTYIKTYGTDSFKECIDNALTEIDFKLLILEKKFNLSTSEGIINYIKESCNLLASLDPIIQDEYAKKIASKTNLSPSTISEQIKSKESVIPALNKEASPVKRRMPKELEEAQINFFLFAYELPESLESFNLTEDMFTPGFFRWFYKKLDSLKVSKPTLNDLITEPEDQKFTKMTSKLLMMSNDYSLDSKMFETSLIIIQKYYRQKRIEQLQNELLTADQNRKEEIFGQLIELKKVDWMKL